MAISLVMFTSTHRIVKLTGAALLTLPVWGGSVVAADMAMLSGPDGVRVELPAASLAELPATEAASAYRRSKGIEAGIYKGVLLWDLLQARGLVGKDVKPALRNTVLAIAGDGHEAACSVGEIAPDFGNTPILLAYEMNGQPIPDGLRMVVPGDMHGARHIKDIVTLDFR